MRYAGTDRDNEGPWFRLGQLEVTTTVGALLLWGVGLILFIVEPVDKPISSALVLDTDEVARGELWRLITWPAVMPGFGIGTILTAVVFWMFGTELERQLYRAPFLRLLLGIVATYTAFYLALSFLLGGAEYAAGLSMPTFAITLLYIAEHPNRPFFFGIPAWVIGAAIVALEVINDLAYRQWIQLLTVILASIVIALIARRMGLLTQYDRIPDLRRDRPAKPPKAKRKPSGRGGLASKLGRQPKAEIVEMQTAPRRPSPPVVVPDTVNADDLALDALLDKISAGGMDALTDEERRQLDEIRERRSSTD